ncbi:MAG: aspartate aminotransferase family protein [Desulfobacteraceae bacterium]|nr:aspartate aminotransferase family protein [Desulfobacteraceae bacterium]
MDTFSKTDQNIINTYARVQKVFVSGKGCVLKDEDNNSYIDFLAGIAVCSLGHCHPKITKAISDQASKLVHVSNLFYTQPQAELASMLVEKSFADKVFFANSGAEANEAAIKLARRYFYIKGDKSKFKIITMEKSFHGRTMAALSATGQEKIRQGFDPVLEGFIHVPFNDIKSLKKCVEQNSDSDSGSSSICAIMLEPVQGEGGVILADPDYLQSVRKLCDDNDILLIFDEIQTGMGRCGRLFAYEEYDVIPDIMTLAKALGNGLPIGAMLASKKSKQGFDFGSHGSTFGGSPLVASAAIEVVRIISNPDFLSECRQKGEYFKQQLFMLKEKYDFIKDIRGMGLLISLEIETKKDNKIDAVDIDADRIVQECMGKGFIINAIQGNILRFAPPLIIEENEIDKLVICLDGIFAKESRS